MISAYSHQLFALFVMSRRHVLSRLYIVYTKLENTDNLANNLNIDKF